MGKVALITGITGQDGSYLADLLVEKGYTVVGLVRRLSLDNYGRISHLKVELAKGDLLDQTSLTEAIATYQPDEVYNLAAQSFVPVSWTQPILTSEVTGLGVARMLEGIKKTNKRIKFFQASSSEMFGNTPPPQNEASGLRPRSPYGVAKVYGHNITVNYRESYDMFAVSGIMFNHESPRRGEEFFTRKVTLGIGKILKGEESALKLGNLDAYRDWGYAPDYMNAAWMMLQQDEPRDYVIATGETHSTQEWVDKAFQCAGIEPKIEIDPNLIRPAEVNVLRGDPSKIRQELGWKPSISFDELVSRMVASDTA